MTVTNEMVQAFLDFIKEDTWAYCGEEEKQYYHIDGLVNVEAALEAALAAMPGPAVKVKPLEWEWVVGDVEVAGPYKLDRMRPWRFGKPKKYWVQVALGSGFRTIATLLPSLEAAKAAAQADYEARILSALTPAPDLAAAEERGRIDERERIREAIIPAYMGLLVLKTMCRKAKLIGGVAATESALSSLVSVVPELPAISALRTPALKEPTP